ncbi:hypothetical protein Bca4012_065722 [Brassica carinata]
MDSILCTTLEEICCQGIIGIPLDFVESRLSPLFSVPLPRLMSVEICYRSFTVQGEEHCVRTIGCFDSTAPTGFEDPHQ